MMAGFAEYSQGVLSENEVRWMVQVGEKPEAIVQESEQQEPLI